MTSAATAEKRDVVRPLSVLAALIKDAMQKAEQAAHAYHEVIGDLLAEARPQFDTYAEFLSWTHRNFGFKETQARTYLSLGRVRETKGARAPRFADLEDFRRRGLGQNRQSTGRVSRDWTASVDDIADRARREAERLRDEHLSQVKERQAEHQLALRLIDIGYKVLAKELHPDKGGSKDAMARLSRVRDRLKSHA